MTEAYRISIGVEHDEELKEGAEEEGITYRNTRQLPEHFELAGQFLREQIENQTPFYEQNKGMYVAVRSVEPFVAEIGSDQGEVIKKTIERWGYRPLYGMTMDPASIEPVFLRPRFIVEP